MAHSSVRDRPRRAPSRGHRRFLDDAAEQPIVAAEIRHADVRVGDASVGARAAVAGYVQRDSGLLRFVTLALQYSCKL